MSFHPSRRKIWQLVADLFLGNDSEGNPVLAIVRRPLRDSRAVAKRFHTSHGRKFYHPALPKVAACWRFQARGCDEGGRGRSERRERADRGTLGVAVFRPSRKSNPALSSESEPVSVRTPPGCGAIRFDGEASPDRLSLWLPKSVIVEARREHRSNPCAIGVQLATESVCNTCTVSGWF